MYGNFEYEIDFYIDKFSCFLGQYLESNLSKIKNELYFCICFCNKLRIHYSKLFGYWVIAKKTRNIQRIIQYK